MLNPALSLPMEAIRDLCRRYQVRELSVFGSALDDRFTPQSDLDLLVEFHPEARAGFIEFLQLKEDLESLVGRRVDLVSKSGLHHLIRRNVLETAEVVYEA
jgi:uncharacterized protein